MMCKYLLEDWICLSAGQVNKDGGEKEVHIYIKVGRMLRIVAYKLVA